jgi:tetratricopeptide (TPR) repeat protein
VLEKVPLFLLAAADAGLTILMQRKSSSVGGIQALPMAWRVKNAAYSYFAYLGDALWPSRLAVFYPHPEASLSWGKALAATAVLIAIAVVVWRFRKRGYLLTGWLWFLGTMVPMIGIVQAGRQAMADRYAYVPLLGIFVAVIWLLGDWAKTLQWKPAILIAIFALALSPYVYLTRKQIGYWKDSYTLFSHALRVTSNNGIAENNFGAALLERGQAPLAEAHFATATRLIPGLASAHYNLGVVLQMRGASEEAAREYRLAIADSSDPAELAQAHNNLGILDLQSNKPADALTELSAAITLNPNELNSYIGRGIVELQFWNADAAIADFSRAVAISPSPAAYFQLGRALEMKGDFPRAENAYIKALQLAPGMSEAQSYLEALHKKMGK